MHENVIKIKELLLNYGYVCRCGAPNNCIAKIEEMLGVKFSEEYKDCLRFTNGGEFIEGAVEMYAVYDKDNECRTDMLLGFANSPQNRTANMPDNYIIIGSDLLGDFICLTPEGLVVQWCHEIDRAFDTHASIYEFFKEFSKGCDPKYAKEIQQ